MVDVHAEIYRAVEKYVAKGNALAAKHKPELAIHKLEVDLKPRRTRAGGEAWGYKWKIWINVPLHEYHPEQIDITVGHEIAHVYGWHVYDAYGHDHNWKRMMVDFGLKPDRCHTMSHTDLVGKNKILHVYRCNNCGAECYLTAKQHNRHQAIITNSQSTGYNHTPCGPAGTLNFQRSSSKHEEAKRRLGIEEEIPVAACNAAPKKESSLKNSINVTGVDRPTTKAGKAEQIFRMNRHLSRKEMIDVFMDHLNMTKAGASTYYQNIKRKYK